MKITKDDVEHVAHLARLYFNEAEREVITAQLNDILLYVDMLDSVDTAGIEPMVHAVPLTNALRDDIRRESFRTGQALANAPESDGEFFLVPRVIE